MVTVALNNGDLLRLYKQKRFLEHQISLERIEAENVIKVKSRASKVDSSVEQSYSFNIVPT